MVKIKKKWRYLVNNYKIFALLESHRYRLKYPCKYLNTNYINSNPTIHFIHKYITSNTGDRACGYYQYFQSNFCNYRCIVHDISHIHFSKIKQNDIVIIGGGGLLNALPEWNYSINKVLKMVDKSVIWSAGFNWGGEGIIKQPINWGKVSLISIRDFHYPLNFRYIPCATCMIHEISKEDYIIKREIGIVCHEYKRDMPSEFLKYDSITNSFPLETIIDFIGSSNVIVTNSYHAAYWSVLMKKKCIIFALKSEKFEYFKNKPVVYSGNLFADINRAVIYPNALDECKKLTLDYMKDILALLEK